MVWQVIDKLKQLSGLTRQDSRLQSLLPGHRDLIRRIRTARLTYLSDAKLSSIVQTCLDVEAKGIAGIYVEAGCALGGSAILIASLKSKQTPLLVHDVFGMIPPPSKEDPEDVQERYRTIVEGKSQGIDGDEYYGYVENLLDVVKSNFQRFGIDCNESAVLFLEGLVQETMHITQPVAFAHIDVDWYEPVKTCLERIFPNLALGGSIILDDYHDWGGCRKAADEFLRTVVGRVSLDDSAGSLKITRTA